MKKCVSLLLLICMCIGLLTGCGVGSSSVNLNSISSMSMEEVAGSRLLASTSQSLESEIYNYVSDKSSNEEHIFTYDGVTESLRSNYYLE